MEMYRLKNGATEPQPIVDTTIVALKEMLNSGSMQDAMAFYDLVRLCRGVKPSISSSSITRLKDLGLLNQNTSVNQSVRNTILSCVVGEGLDMTIVSPVE